VVPSLRRLRDFLAGTYLPQARQSAGLGAVPGGREWYRELVRWSTTTALTPEEIHSIGLREVARVSAELAQIQEQVFGETGPLGLFLQSLNTRTSLMPFRTEDEVLQAYRALNDKVRALLPTLFERIPAAQLEVRLVAPERRDTATDYYNPPAADGSRPGVFYLVVPEAGKYTVTTMTAMLLHEGWPGHHYQAALHRELPLPRFRRYSWYEAFGEGWALYAEGLGQDLGLYGDPVQRLGRLLMEQQRAVRLVVDTGLHAMGWSREQAIRYVMDMEGRPDAAARRMVERYMAWPGQALAYKVGELRILALREQARQAQGARFDVRRFHWELLRHGTLPLSILERKIADWLGRDATG